jgi:class 3 adenylate cyclase
MQDSQADAFGPLIDDLQAGGITFAESGRRAEPRGLVGSGGAEREVSAVSVEVVQARDLRACGSALDAQLTFDAYRRMVERSLTANGCSTFSWAGDSLLAVFRQAEVAVETALALLQSLPQFNSYYNRLGRPLTLRIGVHSGPIVPDQDAGPLSCGTFDVAAQLQRAAGPDRLLISERTYGLSGACVRPFGRYTSAAALPTQCWVFPFSLSSAEPKWAGPEPAPTTTPIEQTPREPVPPSPVPSSRSAHPPPIVWVLGGIGLALLLILVVLLGVLVSRQPVAVGAGAPFAAVTPQAPSGDGARPAAAPSPAIQPRQPPGGVPPPQDVGPTPPAATSQRPRAYPMRPAIQPSVRLWRSSAAASGMPGTISPSAPERKWLLAIGITRYRDRSFTAEGASVGARTAAAALQRAAGIPDRNVRVLLDEQATGDSIRLAMLQLQNAAVSGTDTVFLYLAGSASLLPDRPGIRHPGGVGYAFTPADATASDQAQTSILGAEFMAWLGATRAQTIICFVDTSHAAAFDVPTIADTGRQLSVLAACGPLERLGSIRPNQAPGSSLYAGAMVQALRGSADQNRDQRVSLTELVRFLSGSVRQNTGGAQAPQTVSGFGGFLPELYLSPIR